MKRRVFLLLSACEKLSEIFKRFVKDFLRALLSICARFSTRLVSEGKAVMAKQTKITIETDSLLILKSRISRRAWCPLCAAESEVIVLDNVGVISNLERSALEEWLNSEELHRSEAADGSVQICLNSLLARVQNTKSW
jgi:hypothetical protein